MLCLKAEALDGHEFHDHDLYPPHSLILPMDFGSTIQRYLKKGKDGIRVLQSRLPNRSSSSSSSSISIDGFGSSSGLEGTKTHDGAIGRERGEKTCVYKSQLEQDIKYLQKQLEEEIELHLALASVVEHPSAPMSNCPRKLPKKTEELLASIAALESTVSKLEQELVALHFQLTQEKNERRLAEYHLRRIPISSPSRLAYTPASSKELMSRCEDRQEREMDCMPVEMTGWKMDSCMENLWHQPNQLSEEMVRCMRNIFLSLADSSKLSYSGYMASPASPIGHHHSRSSVASLSDSFTMPALIRCSSVEHDFEVSARENMFDPYHVHGKSKWMKNIGSYAAAADVTWMSVGEKQLEYAAGALKKFRLLVEQLAKVNPGRMSCNEKLAFWINLYNALIMHAYLAYGVPRSDIKLFSLMQKVAYTVGGHSFSAADIEYIILKMKPPAHRPQIALVLALHKFKISEEQKKYCIESSEPLLTFALSCGMYSSPAVRIFKPKNVIEDLQDSMRDYIRASVGISSKGKLIVPKLLHCYAKGIVEDSLLPDWICQFLSPEQAAMVRNCSSHHRKHRQRLLSPRSFTVLPFDSRFRYLFLFESGSFQTST